MSKFAPWTEEEAEKWLDEIAEVASVGGDKTHRDAARFAADLAFATAAARIEKCPSLYAAREGSRIWGLDRNKYDDTMEAKLVGVREVEK